MILQPISKFGGKIVVSQIYRVCLRRKAKMIADIKNPKQQIAKQNNPITIEKINKMAGVINPPKKSLGSFGGNKRFKYAQASNPTHPTAINPKGNRIVSQREFLNL